MVWTTIWIRNTLQLVKELKVWKSVKTTILFFCKQQEGKNPELAVKLFGDNKIISLYLKILLQLAVVLFRFNLIKLLYLQVQQNFLLKLISIEQKKLMNVHKNVWKALKKIQKLRVMLIHFALELHSNVLKQDLKQLKQILVNI